MIRTTFIALLLATSANAATLTEGRGASSDLRSLTASGPVTSEWTNPPAPGEPNSDWHEGRGPGTFEDRGMGVISGQCYGLCDIAVQDLGDSKIGSLTVIADGRASVFDFDAPKRANGNWMTVSLGLAESVWHDFKMVWSSVAGQSSHGVGQDGYGVRVCR